MSNIDTIKYFLTIPSLCLTYIVATNVGLPTATMCMRLWITIREDMINLCTEVGCKIFEVVTVAVATYLDASSEMRVICIYLLQRNLDLLMIDLGLVVLPKGVKCVFKTNFVSIKGESGLFL